MTPTLHPTRVIRCPQCRNKRGKPAYVAYAQFPAIVTGRVKRGPADGDADEIDGLGYSQCGTCKWFVRYEFPPPGMAVSLVDFRTTQQEQAA